MALTPSTMLDLGTVAPEFSLPNAVDEKLVSLRDFASCPALLVMFICNHCPYVIHIRAGLTRLAKDYMPKGLGLIAINANSSVTHPQDGPAPMRQLALELGWEFPFLFDKDQAVAKAYKAACTPDFFLFDKQRKLVYRGQFDSSRPGNGAPVTGQDLREAVEAVLAARPVSAQQRASVGCSIKWNPGSEPDYLR